MTIPKIWLKQFSDEIGSVEIQIDDQKNLVLKAKPKATVGVA